MSWDTLTHGHRQEIIDHVHDMRATLRFGCTTADIEDICRFAIDGLGRSTPLADEYERGFEDGRQQGFTDLVDAVATAKASSA